MPCSRIALLSGDDSDSNDRRKPHRVIDIKRTVRQETLTTKRGELGDKDDRKLGGGGGGGDGFKCPKCLTTQKFNMSIISKWLLAL